MNKIHTSSFFNIFLKLAHRCSGARLFNFPIFKISIISRYVQNRRPRRSSMSLLLTLRSKEMLLLLVLIFPLFHSFDFSSPTSTNSSSSLLQTSSHAFHFNITFFIHSKQTPAFVSALLHNDQGASSTPFDAQLPV